jgi:hypothetical protein
MCLVRLHVLCLFQLTRLSLSFLDLGCILHYSELDGSLRRCPICRSVMHLLLFDFNPGAVTCSVIDLHYHETSRRVFSPSTEEDYELGGTKIRERLCVHSQVRTSVPTLLVRHLIKDKTQFLNPIQLYRRSIYLDNLFIVDPKSEATLKLLGMPSLCSVPHTSVLLRQINLKLVGLSLVIHPLGFIVSCKLFYRFLMSIFICAI